MGSDGFAGLDALINKRVDERMRMEELSHETRTVKNKSNDPEPQDAAQIVNSVFNTKTQDEQRQIVGDAVRSVMDKYDLKATPKTTAAVTSRPDACSTKSSRYDR